MGKGAAIAYLVLFAGDDPRASSALDSSSTTDRRHPRPTPTPTPTVLSDQSTSLSLERSTITYGDYHLVNIRIMKSG